MMGAGGWMVRLAAMVLLAAGASCQAPADPTAPPGRIPVMVDTDMGADDILALLYLFGRPDVEVVAVSVVGDGLVRCPAGAANARAVLTVAGSGDTPVACGSDRPLVGHAAFPDTWRTQADNLYDMSQEWPLPSDAPAATTDPVALLAEQAVRHPGLRILALGPLTSVAAALRRPDVVETRPQIIVSGGAMNEPGNMPASGSLRPVAEWNIGVDPVAADEVLRTGLASRWITLDASNDVPIDVWFVQALAATTRSRAGEAAFAFLQANPGLSRGGFYFWDPLAAVALTTPETVASQPATLAVRTTGPDIGRTAADPAGTPVTTTTKADPTAFAEAMLQAYRPAGGTPPATYAPGTPDVLVARQLGAFRLDAPATLPAGDTAIGFDATHGGAYDVAIGRLADRKTLADVDAAIAYGVTSPPPWFELEATVEVPAGARPTWLINLPSGRHAVVAASNGGATLTTLGQITTR